MEKEQKSNEKENVVIDDFDFSLIADFFQENRTTRSRRGQGNEACGKSYSFFRQTYQDSGLGLRLGTSDSCACKGVRL